MKRRGQTTGVTIIGVVLGAMLASTVPAEANEQRRRQSRHREFQSGYGANLHSLAYQIEEEAARLHYRLEQAAYGGYGRYRRGYRGRALHDASRDAKRLARRARSFRRRVSRGIHSRRLGRELDRLQRDFYRIERWRNRLAGHRGFRSSVARLERLLYRASHADPYAHRRAYR